MHMFRKWIPGLLLTLLLVLPVASADKEKEDYIPDEGAIQVLLLRHKSVRHELKLTDDQSREIREFASKQWKKAKAMAGESKEKRHEKFNEMAKENDKFLEKTLKPAQRKRLHQITMQEAGLLWVTRPDVASELKLTDAQKKKAKELQEEARKEMHHVLHKEKAESREGKLRELRKINSKRLHELLTEDQRAAWKKLRGEPFKGDFSKGDFSKD